MFKDIIVAVIFWVTIIVALVALGSIFSVLAHLFGFSSVFALGAFGLVGGLIVVGKFLDCIKPQNFQKF